MAFGSYNDLDNPYGITYSGASGGGGGLVGQVGKAGALPAGAAPPAPSSPSFDFGAGDGGGGTGGGGGGGGSNSYALNFDFEPVPTFNPDIFKAPTFEQAKASPGYQFRLDSGVAALDRGAASRGDLRTGGHNKDILEYGQNTAAQEYSSVFDRALKEYGAKYQAQRDMFAPQLAGWQRRAAAEQAKQLALFNSQFYKGGGGGGGGASVPYGDIMGPEPAPPVWG